MPVVLVTDTDQELAEIFGTYLAKHGFHVVQPASGGVECLEMLRRYRPDVLVLDWELPWGGGDGVLACLREEDRATMPAVVLISDHDCPPELADAPIVGRLRKPFKLTELIETIVDAQELLVSP